MHISFGHRPRGRHPVFELRLGITLPTGKTVNIIGTQCRMVARDRESRACDHGYGSMNGMESQNKDIDQVGRVLYHGTTRKALREILRSGIVPRTPEDLGSWPSEVSRAGFVYLTEAHAIHYAVSPHREYRGDYALVEVSLADIPESRLYPDEDYLTQEAWPRGSHHGDLDWKLEVAEQKHRWRDSLERLGNVAVAGVIPPTAITRYAILSRHRLFWAYYRGPDSARLIHSYSEKRAGQQDVLSLIFDDVPRLKRHTRAEFDRALRERTAEERDRLWQATQAVQVVALDRGKVTGRTARNLPLEGDLVLF